MQFIDFTTIDFAAIVNEAWEAYDNTRKIIRIVDISAKVSTNHVYRVTFSEPVSNVDINDFTLVATGASSTAVMFKAKVRVDVKAPSVTVKVKFTGPF